MSSFENSQRSTTSGLQLPGLVKELSPAQQLPFPDSNPVFAQTPPRPQLSSAPAGPATPGPDMMYPGITQPLSGTDSTVGVTRQLAFNGSPAVTRILPDVQTGTLPSTRTTTSLRQPIVIQGTGKKSPGTMRPPRGRSWVITSSIVGVMLVLMLLTSFVVIPLATGNHPFSNPLTGNNVVQNNNPNFNANVIAQAATATAITRIDGYYSGPSTSGPLYTGTGVTPDRFAYGQCTFWADTQYHNLTGHWVDWIGNAYQWAAGARAAGWNVSTTPRVPSIIVLQPYVEGASYYGHVAVVERINSDGSVWTSNMNWYANGGWDTLSYWTFTPGAGVLFVWHS
ncbi:MAG TPA: CHAP domain-containing protein [Ktedonobacteraceae bacterium]|nr:CHAP domain-containing protein [Ktedonobacteraceae bacterium]